VIVRRYTRRGGAIASHDSDDLEAAIHLRLIARLRAIVEHGHEGVRDLERYIAMLAFNALNDHLRKAFPERARLKNQLRYTLLHDHRLAMWTADDERVGGLREWSGTAPHATHVHIDSPTPTMLQRERLGDAVAAIFERIGGPVALDALVDFTAAIWNVVEVQQSAHTEQPASPAAGTDGGVLGRFEMREYLRALWREIRELRPMQRKALLLNLRSGETTDVISLLVLTGVASYDELAEALDMTANDLAALWNDLPLDDLRIADLLHVTRQQVINLRKSARDRLARRMSRTR
jgi:hypothetical protein